MLSLRESGASDALVEQSHAYYVAMYAGVLEGFIWDPCMHSLD